MTRHQFPDYDMATGDAWQKFTAWQIILSLIYSTKFTENKKINGLKPLNKTCTITTKHKIQ